MKKSSLALAITMTMGSGINQASIFTSGTFSMWSPYGDQTNPLGNDTTVTGSIGGGVWNVASTKEFFGKNWTTHGGTTFGPGTYTFNTVEGPSYTNVVVGPGQVGGHILFDWNMNINIDVLQVWDVVGNTYTSTIVSSSGGICAMSKPGAAMIDGPFPGFCANFDFTVVPIPATVWLFGSGLVGLVGVARMRKA